MRNHILKYAYPGGGVTAHIFSELPQVLISLSCKISKQKHSSMYFKLIYFFRPKRLPRKVFKHDKEMGETGARPSPGHGTEK